jgi:glutathione S-transferase
VKLYYTPTSPFVRKPLIVAHELGILERIETSFLRPTPVQADPSLSKDNPLAKIPVLVTDDGISLFDSPVICEYLSSLVAKPRLLPPSGPARWQVLRLQALCDGILDASVLVYYERTLRPKELHWQPWLDGQTQKALQGLDELERDVEKFGNDIDLAQICVGVTLGWLEFREAIGDVRGGRPKLFAWYAKFCERPSMKATAPHP